MVKADLPFVILYVSWNLASQPLYLDSPKPFFLAKDILICKSHIQTGIPLSFSYATAEALAKLVIAVDTPQSLESVIEHAITAVYCRNVVSMTKTFSWTFFFCHKCSNYLKCNSMNNLNKRLANTTTFHKTKNFKMPLNLKKFGDDKKLQKQFIWWLNLTGSQKYWRLDSLPFVVWPFFQDLLSFIIKLAKKCIQIVFLLYRVLLSVFKQK